MRRTLIRLLAEQAVERLSTLESIRREYHAWRYGDEPRLQRVCRIVERDLENLKSNKRAVGRHQDLADLENLE